MSDYDGGRTSSTTSTTLDYSNPQKSEIGGALLDADDFPNAVTATELGDTMYYHSGENITATDGNVIDTNSFVKNGYTYSDQIPINQVYNFEKQIMTDVGFLPLKFTEGAVTIIEQIGTNIGGASPQSDSIFDQYRIQFVKLFAYATSNTVFFRGYTPQSGDLGGAMTYIADAPYSYTGAGSGDGAPGSGRAEGNKLDRKFSFDGSTAPIQPYEFTQSKINDFADKLINDLENNVLSRFDVVKTTTPLQLTDDTFENITSDEVAETSTPSGVIITETSTSPSGGGSTSGDGGAY